MVEKFRKYYLHGRKSKGELFTWKEILGSTIYMIGNLRKNYLHGRKSKGELFTW